MEKLKIKKLNENTIVLSFILSLHNQHIEKSCKKEKGLPYGESNPGLLGTLNPEDLKANRDSHYTIKEIAC